MELFKSNIPKRLKEYWKRLKNRINKIDKKYINQNKILLLNQQQKWKN